MVLTAAQTRAFFRDADQMAIPDATVTQLATEGIATVSDLGKFEKDSIKQVVDNLRNPGGRIANPDPALALVARSVKTEEESSLNRL